MEPAAPGFPCRQLLGSKCESYDGQQLTYPAFRDCLVFGLGETRVPWILSFPLLPWDLDIPDSERLSLFPVSPKQLITDRQLPSLQMEYNFERPHVQMLALGIIQLSPC